METTNMNLTGKASIDKPWLKYYPEELHNMETPKITLEEFLKMKTRMIQKLHLNIMEIKSHGRHFGKK